MEKEWFTDLPEHISIHGSELEKKSEFHVSLMHLEDVIPQLVEASGKEEDEIGQELIRIYLKHLEASPITFEGFLDDLRLAEKEERRSVVVRCVIANLDGFFEALEKAFNTHIDRQPVHVTLYTLGHNKGIGINRIQDMESLERVAYPEVTNPLLAGHPHN